MRLADNGKITNKSFYRVDYYFLLSVEMENVIVLMVAFPLLPAVLYANRETGGHARSLEYYLR